MALQLAYFRLYNKLVLTYESAATRIFRHGRTETGEHFPFFVCLREEAHIGNTVRSATQEALAFCNAMEQPTLMPRTKLQLLRQAVEKHVQLMKEAMDGQGTFPPLRLQEFAETIYDCHDWLTAFAAGCDRHLIGLRIVAHGLKMEHDFLKNPAVSMKYTLSTSQTPVRKG